MEDSAYSELNFMQRMAVRHAVFKQYSVKKLVETGMLERALESIASDAALLQAAADAYDPYNKSDRIIKLR